MAVEVKITADISDLQKDLKVVTSSFQDVQKEAVKATTGINKAVGEVNLSLGEMKKELRDLRNTSFAGKTEEEVKRLKNRMAELTDEIRDFQEKTRTASEKGIPGMINGLTGIVAGAQAVTASLALFGVQNDKLEKTMIQLIGAAQGLATIEDLLAKKKIQVALAEAKDTAEKIKNTIATKANEAAANSSTTVMKSLFTLIAKNPMAAAAVAAAALAVAIYSVATSADAADQAMKDFTKAQEEANAAIGKDLASLQVLQKRLNDANLPQAERIRLINELDKKYPGYLSQAEKEAAIAGEAAINFEKLALAIQKKALAAALSNKVAENTTKILDLQLEQQKLLSMSTKTMEEQLSTVGSPIQRIQEEIDRLTLNNRAFSSVIATQENQLDGYNKGLGKVSGGLKNMNKEIKENTKETKQNTKEQQDNYKYAIDGRAEILAKADEAFKKEQETDALRTKINISEVERIENLADVQGWYVDLMLAYNDKLAADEKQKHEERLKRLQEIADRGVTVTQNAGQIVSDLRQIEENELSAQQEQMTTDLEKEYDKRVQAAGKSAAKRKKVDEWYAKEKEKIDEQIGTQSTEIQRKYQKIQQGIAIANAVMLGAQGIMNVWSQRFAATPVIGQAWAIALTALIAATTATQVGVIASQKFAQGGTGVLGGEYHSGGGVAFGPGLEAERDERWAIFSRSATRKNPMLPDLIDAINAERLVIDKDMMTHMLQNGGSRNTVLVANFKGGEHLSAMRRIMERQENKKNIPGRVKLGITNRKYLN